MPKWKKDSTRFRVSVNYHPTRGIQCFIPKPIAELLGNPEQVTFVIKGGRVEMEASKKEPKEVKPRKKGSK